ncbi:MAG: hypothetical protein OEW24_00745 [Chloroflexota bacterium]|nr:hypothetical protein [Chloroflexota bacterium]
MAALAGDPADPAAHLDPADRRAATAHSVIDHSTTDRRATAPTSVIDHSTTDHSGTARRSVIDRSTTDHHAHATSARRPGPVAASPPVQATTPGCQSGSTRAA